MNLSGQDHCRQKMIRQDVNSDNGCFMFVKIFLLLLHILGLFAAIIAMVWMVNLFISVSDDPDFDEEKRENLSKNISKHKRPYFTHYNAPNI